MTGPAAGGAGTTAIGPFKPRYAIGHPVARTIGKVFFNHMGEDLVCSAGIVNSASRSLVWTAGHCVADEGHFAQNWIFVPNYNMDHSWPQSPAPYGYWYARWLLAPGDWVDHGISYNDIGAAVMWPSSSGTRIQDYLGAQGISFNLPYFPFSYAYGYPADPPYDGEYLYLAIAQAHDAGGSVIYMENSMTGGSSGGYWLTNFDGEYGVVNGHNSFGFDHLPQYTYSPYYGLATSNFYNLAQNANPMA
ncbi:trypsin-like serine peptidase [Polymorphospora rubra]|uniref:trypsin-like serine peptidase n=1 Tax=Polymorphospora rubra TaxID=338584 RepID=UPI0033DB94B8